MMADDMNWEAELDWSKMEPCGGRPFYDFVKKVADESLAAGVTELTKIKAEREEKMNRLGEIARRAARLNEDFVALTSLPSFTDALGDIDRQAFLVYGDGTMMTVGRWMECGRHITDALAGGTRLTEVMRRDVAEVAGQIAKVESLREFLKGYVAFCDDDFRFRNAPARFKSKLFREVTRRVNALVAAGEKITLEAMPAFVGPIKEKVATIRTMAAKTQRMCRLAKKAMERNGERFWADEPVWAALNGKS